jgi:peptidoglycan/LPS O-acetylase OafA/YrhL
MKMLEGLIHVLAMAVVFSHTGLTPDFHLDQMAVVVFFMIAGYVMTYSFRVNFSNDIP